MFVRSLADEFKGQRAVRRRVRRAVHHGQRQPRRTAGSPATRSPTCAPCRWSSAASPDVDPHEVLGRIRAYCDELQEEMRAGAPRGRRRGLGSWRWCRAWTPAESSPALALGALLGGTPSTDKVTYGTEAGLFQAAGIETVVCGPGDIQQAHAPDEFIELDQIQACEDLLDRLDAAPRRRRHGRSTCMSTTTIEHDWTSAPRSGRGSGGPWWPRPSATPSSGSTSSSTPRSPSSSASCSSPPSSGATGLLLTFGTFAISYLIRPIGAMVIGAYGDRAGRKQALSLTIFAMMLGTGDHGVRAHGRLHRRLGRRGHPRLTAAAGVLGRWRVRHGHSVPHRERPEPQGVLRQLAGGHPGRWRCSWPRRSASA